MNNPKILIATIERWFWDKKLSYLEPGDTFYSRKKKKDGRIVKLYGKIKEIVKDFETVTIYIERNSKKN